MEMCERDTGVGTPLWGRAGEEMRKSEKGREGGGHEERDVEITWDDAGKGESKLGWEVAKAKMGLRI